MYRFRFKTSYLACGALLALAAGARAQNAPPPFALHDGDRVVFYGDSITEQRLYTTFTENYIVTRFPHLQVSFVHSGWGGDRVTGGGGGPIDLRLKRDVIAYKPTVMTIMLGMNDGGYHAFDQNTSDTYTQGYTHIIDTVQSALPGIRITLIEPSPFDDVTRPPQFDGGYNGVLMRYAQFVKDTAAKDHFGVADFNTPVDAMLTKANAADPTTAQKILPDRVHPSPGGHLVMAEALLQSWNAPSTVTDVEINAPAKRVVHAVNSQVTAMAKSGSTFTWTQNDGALPFPLPPGDPLVALALKSSDFISAMDQENLRVDGLTPTGHYSLKIDGEDVGEFTGTELASGVNLATLQTPMAAQAAQVAGLTGKHDDQHSFRWRVIQVPLQDDANDAVRQAVPPLLTALDSEEAVTVAQQHAAAQPVPHHYEIGPIIPGPTGPNLALNKPYVTSSPNKYNFGMNALTDGSWDANGQHTFATDDSDTFPKTATVDLGAAAKLGAVRVGVPPFGSTETIQVSVSADGQNFTPVGTYVFTQRREERHLYRFAPIMARFVRLTYPDHYSAEADYSNKFAFTSEVEAYAP
ncbi:MAG: GDSL-type esterase/lipase family protein [Janthinobacterium lividum]